MPTWPAALRFCPNLPSYTEQPVDAVIRTHFDTGPQQSRPRFTAVPERIGFTLIYMTRPQYEQFRAFFAVDLAQGALPFDAMHPVIGEMRTFRFLSPYQARLAGEGVSVQIELEMLP